ncbi:MAG: dihydrodipicolinate synthase family protein [Bacillota bacterium]
MTTEAVQVDVHIFGTLLPEGGKRDLCVRVSPELSIALKEIEQRLAVRLGDRLDRDVIVLVNGRRVLGDFSGWTLKEGDTVVLVPPLGGGFGPGRRSSFRPEGVYVALLTPFNNDGRVDVGAVRDIVEFAVSRGVAGIFPVSSVGEFIHLGGQERARLIEAVVDQCRGRVPVAAGVADTTPAAVIGHASVAQRLGCDAVVICPPYYFRPSEEQVEKHFEVVADALPELPIILYNIPSFTVPLGYDTVKRLSRRPNIVGMKDSSGSMVDMMHFMDKVRIAGAEFNVLTGREDMLFPALVAGAAGCMVASAGIVPELITKIWDYTKNGNFDEARSAQVSILQLVRAMFALPFPVGFKAALEIRGFRVGALQQPLSNAEQYLASGVKARINKLLYALAESYGFEVRVS